MIDSAELRVHPTGKAILKLGVKSQGQGHETTFAQIVADELGIPMTNIKVVEGDTDNTPYGLGTYASRSTPTAGAATAMVSRKLADKAKQIAAHLLEAADADIELENGKFSVRGTPSRSVTIQDVALAAYTNLPDGMEYGLEGVHYYDPPNLTFPYGSYIVVVDVDPETGVWKVRRMVALDDCGVRINPMIVEGQIHGGLTEGFAKSSMQWITFDEDGNCIGSNFMDYLIPTAWETPKFELLETCVPSPHHPIGAKGVGESATVGSPAAYVNAVIDALAHLGVRNIDMPLLPDRVWSAIQSAGVDADGRRRARRRGDARRGTGARSRSRPWCGGAPRARDGPVRRRSCCPTGPCGVGSAVRAPSRRWCARRAPRSKTASRGCCSSVRPTSSMPVRSTARSTVPMACESEGALQVYIEPFLPVPQLVVVGRSPAVHALTIQARALEWDVAVIDDGGDADEHPHPELVRTTLDFSDLGIGSVHRDRRRDAGSLRRARAAMPRSRPTRLHRCRRGGEARVFARLGAARRAASTRNSSRACTRPPGSISARSPTPRSRSRCSPTSSPGAPPARSAGPRRRRCARPRPRVRHDRVPRPRPRHTRATPAPTTGSARRAAGARSSPKTRQQRSSR